MSNKQHHDEDEYMFPEAEQISASSSAGTSGTADAGEASATTAASSSSTDQARAMPNLSIFDRIPQLRRVSLVLVVVVVAFIGFRFLHGSADTIKKPKPQAIPSAAQAQVQIKPVESAQTRKVIALESQVSQLNDQVSDSHQAQLQMATLLKSLVNQVGALNQKLTALKAAPKPAPAIAKKPAAVVHKLKYQVKAIIPGRAWLLASNGKTTTVRVNDVVPGYGKVKLIDADNGLIAMSDGEMIRYGDLDN